MLLTHDDLSEKQLRRKAKERFATANRVEKEYLRSLRQLTRQIEHMVKSMGHRPAELEKLLQDYAKLVEPWARSIAEKMVARVMYKDENAWTQLGRSIGRELRKEIQEAPTGDFFRKYMDEQVTLITSLPLEAAQRVHKLVIESQIDATRAKEISAQIMQTGKVTESRAKLIARTEVARAASALVMARSKHIGVTHYIWRTSGDADVRQSHKEMNGKVVAWDDVPTLSDGTITHAGMIYNCRCYPDPIITND